MNVNDKVRFKNDDEFGVIVKQEDVHRCTVRLSSGKQVKEFYTELVPDFPIPTGSWCIAPTYNNMAFLIMGKRRAAPSQYECEYDYHYQLDTGPGLSAWINGAYLKEIKQIARPASVGEFQAALESRIPLTYIPQGFQNKGFTIAFRGDDRSVDRIFREGFTPRREHVSPVFRTLKTENGESYPQFDIETSTGVCVSRNPAAAAMFPLIKREAKRTRDETNLYAFFAYQPFHTMELQEAEATRGANARYRGYIESLLQGEELVLGKEGVPPETILVGFEVHREWDSTDWTAGCRYEVIGGRRNPQTFYNDDPNYDAFRRTIESKIWDIHRTHSPRFTG